MAAGVGNRFGGLRPEIFSRVGVDFVKFLENLSNPMKDEFYIPFVIDCAIKENGERVKVLTTQEKWYGVTYREDKESVVSAVKKLFAEGIYDGI